MEASSTSLQLQRTENISATGTFTYWAKAPSKSEAIHIFSMDWKPCGLMHGRTSTRVLIALASPPAPTATTRPQQSVPWMSGNGVAAFQPPSARATASRSAVTAASSVAVVTDAEYQPRRVLISVLLTPAASTCSNTSPGAGSGIGTSR